MAAGPENHPDPLPRQPSDTPRQITPAVEGGRDNAEEPTPSDDSGYSRDDGRDALA